MAGIPGNRTRNPNHPPRCNPPACKIPQRLAPQRTRYGIPSVVRVLVSQPFLRYEAVKRSIAALLADYKEPDSEDFRVGIDFLMARAEEVFAVAA